MSISHLEIEEILHEVYRRVHTNWPTVPKNTGGNEN